MRNTLLLFALAVFWIVGVHAHRAPAVAHIQRRHSGHGHSHHRKSKVCRPKSSKFPISYPIHYTSYSTSSSTTIPVTSKISTTCPPGESSKTIVSALSSSTVSATSWTSVLESSERCPSPSPSGPILSGSSPHSHSSVLISGGPTTPGVILSSTLKSSTPCPSPTLSSEGPSPSSSLNPSSTSPGPAISSAVLSLPCPSESSVSGSAYHSHPLQTSSEQSHSVPNLPSSIPSESLPPSGSASSVPSISKKPSSSGFPSSVLAAGPSSSFSTFYYNPSSVSVEASLSVSDSSQAPSSRISPSAHVSSVIPGSSVIGSKFSVAPSSTVASSSAGFSITPSSSQRVIPSSTPGSTIASSATPSVKAESSTSPPSFSPSASFVEPSFNPSSSRAYSSHGPHPTFCPNTPKSRQCWGFYDVDTDYYKTTPETGRTVEYWLSVDNVIMAPDGVSREMMVYNGSFPGPLIEANWGDTLVIHVHNNLTNENGTSVHWHGVLMEHNLANDGVPGVTQCPIPPGETFTYTFRCTSYGTTWYHSHFSLQYSDGLVGPLIIHGPSTANWDIDLGAVMLQDWYHTPAFTEWFDERVNGPPPGDNGLFNGKNKLNDGGEYTEFVWIPGKKYRIRLINSSTDQHFKFWIDQHNMTVQAADFVAIEPYSTQILDIAIGQRYDLIFEASLDVDNYWMRATPATDCSANNNADGIRAIVRYEGADTSAEPTSTAFSPGTDCVDETQLVPHVKRNVGNFAYGDEMDVSIVFDGYVKFTLNGSSLFLDWNNPTLLMVEDHDPSYPSAYNVVSLNGTSETWQYFVIQSTGAFALNHPIHLHGHDFLLIASGKGDFNETVLETANMINPVRRDVVTLPASNPGDPVGGYIVIAFPLDNPGIWILHCHIAWHVAQGLGMQFVERYDEIAGNVGVTSQWQDMCQAWKQFEIAEEIPRDDSGV